MIYKSLVYIKIPKNDPRIQNNDVNSFEKTIKAIKYKNQNTLMHNIMTQN